MITLRDGVRIGPDREGVTAMLSARECGPTRLSWLLIGLTLYTTGVGCARTRPMWRPTSEPPLLGVESRAGGYPNGVAPAESGRKPMSTVRADSAESRTAEAAKPSGFGPIERTSVARREVPIEVTLLPPLPPAIDATARPARPKAISRPAVPPAPTIKSLLDDAKARLVTMTTYQVELTRQERIGEVLQPAEDVILSIRREPRSVRLEWADGPHQGREVLYTAGGVMHINDPHGLIPRLNLAPESPLVMRSSRHPITEAGFDSLLVGLEEGQAARGSDRARYVGIETPEGMNRPCHKLLRKTLDGQSRTVYIDPHTRLPALVTLQAPDGSLLESYHFGNLKPEPTELASATAFDPEARWGTAPSFLSRLAGRHPDGEGLQR